MSTLPIHAEEDEKKVAADLAPLPVTSTESANTPAPLFPIPSGGRHAVLPFRDLSPLRIDFSDSAAELPGLDELGKGYDAVTERFLDQQLTEPHYERSGSAGSLVRVALPAQAEPARLFESHYLLPSEPWTLSQGSRWEARSFLLMSKSDLSSYQSFMAGASAADTGTQQLTGTAKSSYEAVASNMTGSHLLVEVERRVLGSIRCANALSRGIQHQAFDDLPRTYSLSNAAVWFKNLRTYGTDVCTAATMGGLMTTRVELSQQDAKDVSNATFETEAKAAATAASSSAHAAASSGHSHSSNRLSLQKECGYVGGHPELQVRASHQRFAGICGEQYWKRSVPYEPQVLSYTFTSMALFAPHSMRDNMQRAIDDFRLCRGDLARLLLLDGLPAVIQEQIEKVVPSFSFSAQLKVKATSPPLATLAPKLQHLCPALHDASELEQFHAALESLGYRLLTPVLTEKEELHWQFMLANLSASPAVVAQLADAAHITPSWGNVLKASLKKSTDDLLHGILLPQMPNVYVVLCWSRY